MKVGRRTRFVLPTVVALNVVTVAWTSVATNAASNHLPVWLKGAAHAWWVFAAGVLVSAVLAVWAVRFDRGESQQTSGVAVASDGGTAAAGPVSGSTIASTSVKAGRGAHVTVTVSPERPAKPPAETTSGADPSAAAPSRRVCPELLARTGYRNQIKDIAPSPCLVGRERELQELERFCGSTDTYLWWTGGPWTGKTALLSTFTLHPPDGVDVVAFFITRRQAGQAVHTTFTSRIIEQLAAYCGEDPGGVAGVGTLQDDERRRFLADAAERAWRGGRRLVLVIDGLDEDANAHGEAGGASIASLLPKNPEHDLKVIVASRPNPPVPSDVPPDHPLRRCDRRALARTEYATVLQQHAERELREMLADTGLGRDIAGLFCAAGGGLTVEDLSDLTDTPPHLLKPLLHGTYGRSLEARTRTYEGPEATSDKAYLYAHDSLAEAARDELGPVMIDGYRDRLHTWADAYAWQGWPTNTPTYLLAGYTSMLADQHSTARLTAAALDRSRHTRLLARTGSDTAALTELQNAINAQLHHEPLDLPDVAQLAACRDRLADRNSNIPPDLPAVWAQLGQPHRAEALARSITYPDDQALALASLVEALARADEYENAETLARSITDSEQQARALASLVEALARADEHQHARRLAAEAEIVARSITNSFQQALALASLVEALAAGEHERARRLAGEAETAARSITNPDDQALALASLAGALARAGEYENAETLARSITDSGHQAFALASLVEALTRAGEHQHAETLARSITSSFPQALALASLAGALARAGEYENAETLARSITSSFPQALALASLVEALARAGEHQHAETLARSITDSEQQARALASLAGALADAGEYENAETLVRSITDPGDRARALASLAGALADAGEHEHARRLAGEAETVARAITNPDLQAQALVDLVEALARAGEHEHARRLAEEAETVARSITTRGQAQALAKLVGALARAGEHERAKTLIRSITDPGDRARALASLAGALADAGEHEHARRLAGEAETVARAITNPDLQAQALVDLVEALARAGEHEHARRLAEEAETVARSITTRGQAQALASLAGALARAGEHERAETLARSITNPFHQAWALADLLEALARAGEHEHARRLAEEAETAARSITNPDDQARALANLASALARAGEREHGRRLAADIETAARSITHSFQQTSAMASITEALARAGEHEHAEIVARSITNPFQQAHALAVVAEALAVDDKRRAAGLVASALALASWEASVFVIDLVDPAAAIRIAAEIQP